MRLDINLIAIVDTFYTRSGVKGVTRTFLGTMVPILGVQQISERDWLAIDCMSSTKDIEFSMSIHISMTVLVA